MAAFSESHHSVMLSIWQAHNGECETGIAITSDTYEAACLGVSISHMHKALKGACLGVSKLNTHTRL